MDEQKSQGPLLEKCIEKGKFLKVIEVYFVFAGLLLSLGLLSE